jgi:hypothetical protein
MAEVREDGDKDPHQIPRNLYLVSGQSKLPYVKGPSLGRNNRFHIEGMETYRMVSNEGERHIIEFPHNYIDYSDALTITRAFHASVLVANTKADQWYFERYISWSRRIADAASKIHG